jgi:hypothetical protein
MQNHRSKTLCLKRRMNNFFCPKWNWFGFLFQLYAETLIRGPLALYSPRLIEWRLLVCGVPEIVLPLQVCVCMCVCGGGGDIITWKNWWNIQEWGWKHIYKYASIIMQFRQPNINSGDSPPIYQYWAGAVKRQYIVNSSKDAYRHTHSL